MTDNGKRSYKAAEWVPPDRTPRASDLVAQDDGVLLDRATGYLYSDIDGEPRVIPRRRVLFYITNNNAYEHLDAKTLARLRAGLTED